MFKSSFTQEAQRSHTQFHAVPREAVFVALCAVLLLLLIRVLRVQDGYVRGRRRGGSSGGQHGLRPRERRLIDHVKLDWRRRSPRSDLGGAAIFVVVAGARILLARRTLLVLLLLRALLLLSAGSRGTHRTHRVRGSASCPGASRTGSPRGSVSPRTNPSRANARGVAAPHGSRPAHRRGPPTNSGP